MPWWEGVLDAIPVVGTAYRTVNAVAAHVVGDHERAKEQWAEAGMNLAGDALGLVTGGAGKVASVAAKNAIKFAAKEGMKSVSKKVVRDAAKQGGKAAVRMAKKQTTKKELKKQTKKYVKKKVKEAIKEGIENYSDEAAESSEDEEDVSDYELDPDELYRFSGHWRGFYRQFGNDYNVEFVLIIDHSGNMAGKGSDTVSNYVIEGSICDNGSFQFRKQYKGPSATHCVVYTGRTEWRSKPVLSGKWSIPPGQKDSFVLIPTEIGLEAAVISLTCSSAEEVLCMSHKKMRMEIIEALDEILDDTTVDELMDLSDELLVQLAEAVSEMEDYEEYSSDDEN